jgi:two-component sensor histidine kinase
LYDNHLSELNVAVLASEAQFRELQHRVKNSLAMIASLVGLEAEYAADAATRESLQRLRGRVGSIAKLYDLLSETQRTQEVDLPSYVNRILATLGSSYGPVKGEVRFDVSCPPIALSTKCAAPVGLIINELVTNAIKHGFVDADPGIISVHIHQEGERIVLKVSDDGCGLPPRFALDDSCGLGLQIVQMLTAQLGGTIDVAPKPATFHVSFSTAA